jgi:probable rRNA maturation factor
MITIRNMQRKVPIDKITLERDIVRILQKLSYEDYDVGIMIVNDKRMRQYNLNYRSKDAPTDILSFAFHVDLKPGDRIISNSPDDKNLGDLIIDAPYVARAAVELARSFEDHMRILLVHGIYHLLGYDHVTELDYEIMDEAEREMLAYLAQK